MNEYGVMWLFVHCLALWAGVSTVHGGVEYQLCDVVRPSGANGDWGPFASWQHPEIADYGFAVLGAYWLAITLFVAASLVWRALGRSRVDELASSIFVNFWVAVLLSFANVFLIFGQEDHPAFCNGRSFVMLFAASVPLVAAAVLVNVRRS